MKVIKTRSEKTLYDTNGNKVSVIKKEVVEIDTTPHILNREETIVVKEHITTYKNNLQEAKKIKDKLEKTRGTKQGQQIFNSMADLIMVVHTPSNQPHPNPTILTGRVTKDNLIWTIANSSMDGFQPGLTKKKKK